MSSPTATKLQVLEAAVVFLSARVKKVVEADVVHGNVAIGNRTQRATGNMVQSMKNNMLIAIMEDLEAILREENFAAYFEELMAKAEQLNQVPDIKQEPNPEI
ncbi:uncharacterized protein AB675_103 [Cyphellophora attinorum]|uniref:Uncharacterized protein n=1 Tax=Cyphellophora attinorum TaxID=1664694 RepID=A0A0N1HQG0_9EURO|nr:uncharacterized protein AB675_103 [Phialophora attinorum]KPI37732.1 hypothetical protein AB675_103 [Phialophora attinorum]